MPRIGQRLITWSPEEGNQHSTNQISKRDPRGGGGGGGGSVSGGSGGGRSGSSGSAGGSSSSGSRGGSSSSGSSGSSGSRGGGSSSSGSSGSSGSRGGSSSGSGSSGSRGGSSAPYKAPGYRPAPKGIAPNNQGSIYGAGIRQPTLVIGPTFGFGLGYPYGYGHPFIGGPVPPFGWYPIYWDSGSTSPSGPADPQSRPGGPLMTVALAPNGTSPNAPEFIFTADTDSVLAVLDGMEECGFVNVTTPKDLSHNVTVQSYRWDSAVLAQLNVTAPNSTAIPCLNQTIGATLPVATSADGAAGALTASSSQAALVGLAVVLLHMF